MPRLEILEDRTVLSPLVVTNNHDSGAGSLRQAVLDASSGDTIVFANNLHVITLTSGELPITKNLDIEGPGASRLTIGGDDHSRVFEISGGATVTLANLTIADGLTNSTYSIDPTTGMVSGELGGGGILNDAGAFLNLTRCSVVNNQAIAGAGRDVFGGGLLNLGDANVTSSTFTGNQARDGTGPAGDFFGGSVGGGIDNFGGAKLTLTGSTFTGNQAISAAGPYFGIGGAIDNNAGFDVLAPSTATLTDCVFIGNVATGGAQSTANGGAIDNAGFGSTMTVQSCTVVGNHAIGGDGGVGENGLLSQGIGGGIMNQSGSTLDLIDSTVGGNAAVGGNNATITAGDPNTGAGLGGGVENIFLGVLTVTDCTIAGNVARGGTTTSGPGGNALGGGIEDALSSMMTVENSWIVANVAIAGHGGPGASTVPAGIASGGGLDIQFGNADDHTPSTATVIGCTISGNAAVGGAGGSSNNGGAGLGGGISVGINALLGPTFPENSSLTLTDSTVSFNLALGGAGGSGGSGGDGLGGGLFLFSRPDTTASATVTGSSIQHNSAVGGRRGIGGANGQGIGGGVYTLGTFTDDPTTVIKRNHASTSHNNIGP